MLVIGLLLASFTTLSITQKASRVSCITQICHEYRHCLSHPDGVHDLDCFSKHNSLGEKTCRWKAGSLQPRSTYTLIVHQPISKKDYCKVYRNISETSRQILVYEKYNMTVVAVENVQSALCTRAVFKGSPHSTLRCGPPEDVSFRRRFGRLHVNVQWSQDDAAAVERYSVRYKGVGSVSWTEAPVRSDNSSHCTVETLKPSLVYDLQLQCIPNPKCSQCSWSDVYTVPQELTAQPVLVTLQLSDLAEKKGRRRAFVSWRFPNTETHDGYDVTIWKASGETRSDLKVNAPRSEITLILSYSLHHLNISAFNNVSSSPPLSTTVPQLQGPGEGLLDVTVHHNDSFTVRWKDDLIKSFACFSAEWGKDTHKVFQASFHEEEENCKTLSPLPELLEPFKRYTLSLHTRPNAETCNLVHINDSESTYASTRFYFMEGPPVGAPTNISVSNVGLTSAVLSWSSIPEEDVRGFLLGYIIYYKVYDLKGTEREHNVTVNHTLNVFDLRHLRSQTAYQVQISGFTSAGTGVRSAESFFKTNAEATSNSRVILAVFAVVVPVLMLGSPILKRAKRALWQSVPDPRHSDAMQIVQPCELGRLKAFRTLVVEEWHNGGLRVTERESPVPGPVSLLLLQSAEEEGHPAGASSSWIREDAGDTVGDEDGDDVPDASQTCILASGYTTVEMFQQGMSTAPFPRKAEDDEAAESWQMLGYVRQHDSAAERQASTIESEDTGLCPSAHETFGRDV